MMKLERVFSTYYHYDLKHDLYMNKFNGELIHEIGLHMVIAGYWIKPNNFSYEDEK